MEHPPYSHLDKGTLLLATPDVGSGIFSRSVIVLCEHTSAGSFGIIINKPLELDIPDEIVASQHLQNPNLEVRAGGPVQTNQMMLLHSSTSIPDQTIEICPGVYLGGDLQFLQDSIASEGGPMVRLCFGYTGWSAGQLEREFLDGHWYLHPSNSTYIFDTPAEKLWQNILREMGGKYATLSMMPEDLALN